jgi:hypothetical protein
MKDEETTRQRFTGVTGLFEEVAGLDPSDARSTPSVLLTDAIHVVDAYLRIISPNEKFRLWGEDLGLETEAVGHTFLEAFPFLPEKVKKSPSPIEGP